MPRKKGKGNNGSGSAYRLYLFGLCFACGYLPESNTPTATLQSMVRRAVLKLGGNEAEIPNRPEEVLKLMMTVQGHDAKEIEQSVDAMMPIEQMATISGASVETVAENRAQVREARKTTGVFSAETKAARQDLRADRRATRREAIKGGAAGIAQNLLGRIFQ